MKIELVPIESITPYHNNPRDNMEGVDDVARSLEEFGFRQPIVVDLDKVIIVGHTRYHAAKKLGLKEVPIHIAEDLDENKVRAYRIADNKVAEKSKWDDLKLQAEIEELIAQDFDLESLGFSEKELEELMADPDEDKDEGVTETPEGKELKSGFQIVLFIDSEDQQAELLEEFAKRGLSCRAIVS